MVDTLLADPRELEEFILWLPELRVDEAYLVQLMIRSRGLKEKFGFKGTDHVLVQKAVHGYHTVRIPSGRYEGWELWRLRLRDEVERLAVAAARAPWRYVRYRSGTREVDEVYEVPWQLLAVYVQVNPSRALNAARDAVDEVVRGFVELAKTSAPLEDAFRAAFRRPDLRYYAGLARRRRTVFHVVDADTWELVRWLEDEFVEALGYLPARIFTGRGAHFLVDLRLAEEKGVIGRWVGRMPAKYLKAFEKLKSKGCDERLCPEEHEVLRRMVDDRSVPLSERVRALSTLLVDRERGSTPIEVKKQALEPVPGLLYKGGTVVRFKPEEF